jgi:hypothetical protein
VCSETFMLFPQALVTLSGRAPLKLRCNPGHKLTQRLDDSTIHA